MTDQNNEGWPAVLRLNDHYMEEIVGWMQANDKVSGGMTYTRADRAAPEGQVLPKPSPGNETWTVCPDYLVELRDQAGEWAEQTSLEAVEAILLAFVKSSALTPPPAAPEGQVRGANRSDGGFSDPAPTDNTALVERHANKQRNVIINRCSTDLETIINGHDPEIGNLNNDVWDRLDKMAVEIEAALASREAPPAAQEPVAQRCAECDCENGGKECTWIKWTKPQPDCQQETVLELIGDARLALDTGAISFGETADYQPEDIQAILDILDLALRALKGGSDNG